MDPTRIAKWIALPGLVLAAIIAVVTQYGRIEEGWAQEAREAGADSAVIVVEQMMEPMNKQLGSVVDLLRRSEDRDAFRVCMDYSYQSDAQEIRLQNCERESNARWTWWECDDNTPGKCGPQP